MFGRCLDHASAAQQSDCNFAREMELLSKWSSRMEIPRAERGQSDTRQASECEKMWSMPHGFVVGSRIVITCKECREGHSSDTCTSTAKRY